MCPVPLVELDRVSSAALHTKHLRQDWNSLSGLWWQRPVDYFQKWQLADEIAIQFHIPTITVSDSLSVEVIDCNAQVMGTIAMDAFLLPAGNNYNGIPLATYQYRFSYDGLGLPAGRYYVLVTVTRTDVPKRYISEPQDVQADWPNTLLIRYANTENEYDVFFNIAPNFQFRVEGEIGEYRFPYRDSRFVDQVNKPTLLHSDRTRECDLILGAKRYRNSRYGIPKWAVDIASAAFQCSNVDVDGKGFVRAENAAFELNPIGISTLCTATVTLEETNPAGTTTFGASLLQIVEAPGAFPYALGPLTISNGPTLVPLNGFNGIEIPDLAAQTAYLATLNAFPSLSGTFSIENGFYTYLNGPGETYSIATGIAYPEYMDYSISGGGAFAYSYWKGSHLNSWSGVLQHVAGTSGPTNAGNGFNLPVGTIPLRMYHRGTVTRLNFFTPVDIAYLSALPTALPSTMTNFEVQSHNVGAINMASMVLPAAGPLKQFIIRDSGVTTIGATTPFASTPLGQFAQLKLIDLGYNAIATADVDRVFNGVFTNMNYAGGGIIDTQFQTPVAPPSGASSTARTALGFAGWSMFND